MANESFMDKLRCFLGIRLGQEPPRNDFRNPIWSSDDEDDGDDLYTKQNFDVMASPEDMQREFAQHMHDMFRSFGSMFGDMRFFLNDEHFNGLPMPGDMHEPEPDNFDSNSIRDYYLKPGYRKNHEQPMADVDLDGKVSSQDITALLKKKEEGEHSGFVAPFNGNNVPGRSFCKTIITTSVRKPDGTVETKRIVKNGNEVIEETTTSQVPDTTGLLGSSMDSTANSSMIHLNIYNNVMSELSSLFKNFN